MDTRPIGIIDSGSGGLSIWKTITEELPHESIIYIGDHKHAPYSNRSGLFIRKRIYAAIRQLVDKNCKLCIIACNTATVAGIGLYRKRFKNLPIIGVVPVIKTASQISKTKTICILSTKFTAKSAYQKKMIKEFAHDMSVFSVGSFKLVSYVESINDETNKIKKELERIGKHLVSKPVDVVVLGCTHYPFIKKSIQNFFGHAVSIIDSSGAVARQTKRILEHNASLGSGKPLYTFFTTGDAAQVSLVMSRLAKRTIVVERLLIP